jgi:hypothetical protein
MTTTSNLNGIARFGRSSFALKVPGPSRFTHSIGEGFKVIRRWLQGIRIRGNANNLPSAGGRKSLTMH